MKKYISLVFIVIGVLYGAKKEDSSTANPIAIRSMVTGDLLYIANKNKDMNWDMKEVLLPGYLAKRFPFGAVQFRYMKDLSKCLMIDGAYVYIGDCAAIYKRDYRTLFSLLPTTSGAIQIQSIANEKCLLVDEVLIDSKSQAFKIDICYTNRQQRIEMPWLWVIAPAVIEAKSVEF